MIYDFRNLKKYVKEKFGIDSDKVTSNFQAVVTKLSSRELNENIEFDDDGAIYVDKKGNKHKGFLYIENGYSRATALANGYTTIVPTFHVANCSTIEKQKKRNNFNGHYVFSTEVVSMEDLDGKVKELRVCNNCVRLNSKVRLGMLTSAFRKEVILNNEDEGQFLEQDMPKNITTTDWGYTSGWEYESRNYRMKMKFTCEDCGIVLNKKFSDGYFLETHHINGNKKDNDEDNLKCLCVLCHANVDAIHISNYSRGSTKQKVLDFVRMFEDELRVVGNKHLSKYKS